MRFRHWRSWRRTENLRCALLNSCRSVSARTGRVSGFSLRTRCCNALPELQRLPNEGVAELYRMPGWKGKIGLIRPMSHRFCAECDRIRVTADGRLKPCLHSAQEIPLRGLHGENLERALREGMFGKPVSHHMQSGQPSESRRGMSQSEDK